MEISLAELIEEIDGEIHGDSHKIVRGIAPFNEAGIDDITFADSPKILKQVSETGAGAVIVPRNFQQEVSTNLIKSDNPRLAFAKIMHLCFPASRPSDNISPQACIGSNVSLSENVCVGALAVIGDDVIIGTRVIIHPHVVIGNGACIGDDVEIYPNVTILDRCLIGCRVIIHAGTVIGSDGFGFVPDGEKHYKIPQLGIVQIDDDVEIGACNTIDRATFGKTWIKNGVKTDNHVQIAHNVVIGENTLIVAQVGISGSTKIGKNVILAGQAGIAGHISIGDYVTVGPQAGVTRSVPNGNVVSGTPEMPHKLWLRVSQMIPRLPELKRKIVDLEKRLDAFSKK
ncbi:MAG: UDP-3-O-(3-hydroxymyristoyl)glucosamine N-acyltransferase [Desulfobacteraceae bacterium]|nr:UDP-3-O-(3-hydroxymyristoyl)glucosamine N-acyltransferase [Desulfobacteraceae bacterium]MBC2755312.1 UDP-3-O-(3-hydroxymyristoyl)glucosamine N-acyltransferase [Desulfobacteraceae bacterium]